jgi:hypothetical protein
MRGLAFWHPSQGLLLRAESTIEDMVHGYMRSMSRGPDPGTLVSPCSIDPNEPGQRDQAAEYYEEHAQRGWPGIFLALRWPPAIPPLSVFRDIFFEEGFIFVIRARWVEWSLAIVCFRTRILRQARGSRASALWHLLVKWEVDWWLHVLKVMAKSWCSWPAAVGSEVHLR